MSYNRPPYSGTVRIQDWITKDKQHIQGIRLSGASGIAAHLTANEARKLADTLHDLAETLDSSPRTAQPPKLQQPAYTSYSTLTAADGAPEQPLPATPAD